MNWRVVGENNAYERFHSGVGELFSYVTANKIYKKKPCCLHVRQSVGIILNFVSGTHWQ